MSCWPSWGVKLEHQAEAGSLPEGAELSAGRCIRRDWDDACQSSQAAAVCALSPHAHSKQTEQAGKCSSCSMEVAQFTSAVGADGMGMISLLLAMAKSHL